VVKVGEEDIELGWMVEWPLEIKTECKSKFRRCCSYLVCRVRRGELSTLLSRSWGPPWWLRSSRLTLKKELSQMMNGSRC